MKCCKCPLYSYISTENGSEEDCGLFGDWDDRLQYQNKEGTEIVGCYVEKAYIDKIEKERIVYYDSMAEYYDKFLE